MRQGLQGREAEGCRGCRIERQGLQGRETGGCRGYRGCRGCKGCRDWRDCRVERLGDARAAGTAGRVEKAEAGFDLPYILECGNAYRSSGFIYTGVS